MTTLSKRLITTLPAAIALTVMCTVALADWRNSKWQDLPPLGPEFILSGESRAIPLKVINTAAADVAAQPVRGGVPFPKGLLAEPLRLRLVSSSGEEIPIQSSILARWPDQSVKWLLLDFQADLKAKETRTYRLEFGPAVTAKAKPDTVLTVTPEGRRMRVSTGPLKFLVAPGSILRDVTLNGKPVIAGAVDSTLTLDGFSDKVSGEYRLSEGEDWSVAVEEAGPLHAILRVQAWHCLDKDTKFSPSVFRIHAFAKSPFVYLEHEFVFSGNPTNTRLRSLALNIPLKRESKEAVRVAFGRAERPALRLRSGQAALETWTEPLMLFQENLEQPVKPPFTSFRPRYQVYRAGIVRPEVEGAQAGRMMATIRRIFGQGQIIEGAQALGWMTAEGSVAPCLVGVRYFWQLLPKGLEIAPRTDTVLARAWLYPPQSEPLDLRRKDQRFPDMMRELAGPNYNHYVEFLKDNNATGLGRTHEVLLDFTAEPAVAIRRFEIFQEPPLVFVSPAWNAQTQVLGRFQPEDPVNFPDLEKAMAHMLEWMMRHQTEWSHWYGFTDFGCMQYQYLPDKGRWDNLDGKMGWKNDELNNAHTVFLAYLRTGRPEYLRFAETLARHTMDIDTVHYDPSGNILGLQHRHSYDHWSGHVNENHTFMLAMRDFYFLTGNRQALEQIRMAGDEVVRHPSCKPCHMPYVLSRSGDSPMWIVAAAYEATGETKYREVMLEHLGLHEEGIRRVLQTPAGLRDSDSDWFFYDYKCFALTLMERLLEDKRSLNLMIQGSREFKHSYITMYMPWPEIYFATGDRSLMTPLLMDGCSSKESAMKGPVEKDTYLDPFTVCHSYLQRLPYHMAGFYAERPKELILKIAKNRKCGPDVQPLPDTHFEPMDMTGVMNRNPLDDPYRKRGTMASKKPKPLKPGQIGFDFGFVSGCATGYFAVGAADLYPSFTHMRIANAFLGLPFGSTAHLGGVPFDLANPFQNEGRGALVLEKNQAVTIPINRKVARLHFLGHVSGNSDYRDGRVGAEYVIRFASGAVQRIPLTCMRHYAPTDFLFAEPTDTKLVGSIASMVVHRFEVTPNEPDVREIEVRDTGQGEAFTLLALTAEVPGATPAPVAPKLEITFDKATAYDPKSGFGWQNPERLTVDNEGHSVRSDEPNVLRVDLPDGWYRVDLFTGQGAASSLSDVTLIEMNESAGWNTFVVPEIRTFDLRSRLRIAFSVPVVGGHLAWRFSTKGIWSARRSIQNRWTLHKLVFTPIAAPAKPPLGFPKAAFGPAFGWVTSKTNKIECTLTESVRNPMEEVWEDFVRPYRSEGGEIHEFVADVPNGDYDAEIRIGRGFNSQQILDILAEGKVVIADEMFKDQMDATGRGMPETEPPVRKFRVKVEDGQLNLKLALKQRGGLWTLYQLILSPVNERK